MIATFRDALRDISPMWLQRRNAARLLYSLAVHVDAFADALVAGVKQRFPGLYSGDALPTLGRERRIRRGRTETDPVYASRLVRWLDDHRRRGGPYALLAQLHAHFAPSNFPIDLVFYPSALLGNDARRYRMDVDGAVERGSVAWSPDDYEGEDATAGWARWWLFYFWHTPISGDGVWDDPGDWSDGGVWDSELTPDEVASLRIVPTEWNAAHPFGYITLLPPDVELWDYPIGEWDEPGGLWGSDDGSTSAVTLSIGR